MIYSWITALVYALVYSIAVLYTKYKATSRLTQHKRRRSSIKKGLIQHQQNLTPNPARIDEENPTNPTNAPTTPNITTPDHGRRLSESSQLGTVDLTQLHQQLYTSVPYGAPVSNWECFIAILHSLDAGIHINIYIYISLHIDQYLMYIQVFILDY